MLTAAAFVVILESTILCKLPANSPVLLSQGSCFPAGRNSRFAGHARLLVGLLCLVSSAWHRVSSRAAEGLRQKFQTLPKHLQVLTTVLSSLEGVEKCLGKHLIRQYRKWPNSPWQAVPADSITGVRAVGPLKAVHQRTVHAWLTLLEAPVLLEPVRPAGHTLCILPVAEATFLWGLVGKRQPFRLCKLEKEDTVGIKKTHQSLPSWAQR